MSSGIRCVFFSLIGEAKGADLVLEAARNLSEVEFHFYGRVDCGFKQRFRAGLSSLPNVEYHGIFDSVSGDVLAELNQYDLHLLPTSWPNEGVPGVLVETKSAAVPSIVSNCCHNVEVVKDGIDGIVLEECTAQNLSAAIAGCARNPDRLDEMKRAALVSAERFYIDRYVDLIVSELVA